MTLKQILLTLSMLLLALSMLLVAGGSAFAQNPQPTDDPIQQLNLTPEQRQRIRTLTEQTRDERQQTNRRLREANVALDQALDADPVDENLVEQRINELTAAQAAQTRMRIHMELRIRRVLNPDQLATLKRLRLQLRDVMNPQRPNNPRRPNVDAFRPNSRRP
jgi:Spy/CpxP family protein refolding chaperone